MRLYSLPLVLTGLRAIGVVADIPHPTNLQDWENNGFGKMPKQTFHSSNVEAAVYQINKLAVDDPRLNSDDFYFINADMSGRGGPVIQSGKDFSMIWTCEISKRGVASSTGYYRGQRVLIETTPGELYKVAVFNERYELLEVVGLGGRFAGQGVDEHEAFLTKDDSLCLIGCRNGPYDMSAYGGKKDEEVFNCWAQEVDIKSGKLLWETEMLDYFKLNHSTHLADSRNKAEDIGHMNSVQKLDDGNYLISVRNFWSVYVVDGKTGDLRWILGGEQNMFTDITENGSFEFRWQHQARMISPNRMTLFDNHHTYADFCDEDKICSRGLELELDFEAMTVKVVDEWYHPQHIRSGNRGGVERLENGNTIVAWGQNPMFTEHAPDGTVLMDVQRGAVMNIPHGIVPIVAYRIDKGPWVGQPQWGISVAAVTENGKTTIYMSWNGATEVDKYLLMAADSKSDLHELTEAVLESPRTGFETDMPLEDPKKYVRVAALNRVGYLIGISGVLDVESGKTDKDKLYYTRHQDTSTNDWYAKPGDFKKLTPPVVRLGSGSEAESDSQSHSEPVSSSVQGSGSTYSQYTPMGMSVRSLAAAGLMILTIVAAILCWRQIRHRVRWQGSMRQAASSVFGKIGSWKTGSWTKVPGEEPKEDVEGLLSPRDR